MSHVHECSLGLFLHFRHISIFCKAFWVENWLRYDNFCRTEFLIDYCTLLECKESFVHFLHKSAFLSNLSKKYSFWEKIQFFLNGPNFSRFFPSRVVDLLLYTTKMRIFFVHFSKKSDFYHICVKILILRKDSNFWRNGPNFIRIFPSVVMAILITYCLWILTIEQNCKHCKAPWGNPWVIYTPKK